MFGHASNKHGALHLCCISSQVWPSLFLINNERKRSHSASCEQFLASCSLDSSSQHAFIELSELADASRMYQLRNVVTFKMWVPARPQSSAHDPRECAPSTVDQVRQNKISHTCCQRLHACRQTPFCACIASNSSEFAIVTLGPSGSMLPVLCSAYSSQS